MKRFRSWPRFYLGNRDNLAFCCGGSLNSGSGSRSRSRDRSSMSLSTKVIRRSRASPTDDTSERAGATVESKSVACVSSSMSAATKGISPVVDSSRFGPRGITISRSCSFSWRHRAQRAAGDDSAALVRFLAFFEDFLSFSMLALGASSTALGAGSSDVSTDGISSIASERC